MAENTGEKFVNLSRFSTPPALRQRANLSDPAELAKYPPQVGEPFTEEDALQIETVKNLIPGLSALLGKHCELVLNSMEAPDKSVVFSVNAFLSQRFTGAFISRKGLENIQKILATGESYHLYFPLGPNEEHMKAVLIPILNRQGRCLGVLSVGMSFEMTLSDFFKENTPPRQVPTEEDCRIFKEKEDGFGGGQNIAIERAVSSAWQSAMSEPSLKQRDRVKFVIRSLYDKGIFNLRDAVSVVSQILGVSQATVYLHLREIKKTISG